MNKILVRCRDISRAFIDDVGVDGPRTKYKNELATPGVRRYVLERIKNMDCVLCDIERSGATISGKKSEFCKSQLKAVGFLCADKGQHPVPGKVIKISQWRDCQNPKEVRAFLGRCVYYRIWLRNFGIVAKPRYELLKKNIEFVWTQECDDAMEIRKEALTNAPALATLHCADDAGEIILAVDAREEGWGAILQQVKDGKRQPVRYESGVWSEPEKKYNAGKRECRVLLQALKKLKVWLYGVKITVEIDAKTLLHQLNFPIVDLPGAMVTGWISLIRLFDFTVRHVAGRKHSGPDDLSRRPSDSDEEDDNDIVEECIYDDLGINTISVKSPSAPPPNKLFNVMPQDGEYDEHHLSIICFLQTLQVPPSIWADRERKFRIEATEYHIARGILFRREKIGKPSLRVIYRGDRKRAILSALHDESGHRGRDRTVKKVMERYWWKNVYRDAEEYVKSCDECQKRINIHIEEELHLNLTSTMWHRILVDVVHMPKGVGERKYLVVAREDVSGWPEARAIRKANTQTVANTDNYFHRSDFCNLSWIPTTVFGYWH